MFRALTLLISLLFSTYSSANGFEAKVPCLTHDNDTFIGWMTKQECIDKQGSSPDMLGKSGENETLASTILQNN